MSRSFEIKELKSGAVRMAAAAGVPVIPIITWGAHRQLSKGGIRSMGRKKIPVVVEYGSPIDVSDVDLASTESVDEKVAALRATMVAMLHPMQEAYPHPAGEPWVPARLGRRAHLRRGQGHRRRGGCCQSGCPREEAPVGSRVSRATGLRAAPSLIASDVDGTLLDDQNRVSPATVETITDAARAGVIWSWPRAARPAGSRRSPIN